MGGWVCSAGLAVRLVLIQNFFFSDFSSIFFWAFFFFFCLKVEQINFFFNVRVFLILC